jgi:hypothetical protein
MPAVRCWQARLAFFHSPVPRSYLAYIGDQTIIDTKDEDLRKAARRARPSFTARGMRLLPATPRSREAARRAAAGSSRETVNAGTFIRQLVEIALKARTR